jgi:hypothetical protein
VTSRDFCYWLQGFFELAAPTEAGGRVSLGLTDAQARAVRAHLAMVFKHEIDPSMGDEEHQKELDEIHDPGRRSPFLPGGGPGGIKFNC